MQLSIIIVNWNTRELLAGCLESIQNTAHGLACEVIVSDNGSTDGSLELCRMRFPWVTIVENGRNLGFGAANNRGLAVARGDYQLLLNSDTIVQPGALQSALAFMQEHPEVGGLGCKLITADGGIQRSIERSSSLAQSLRYHLRLGQPAHKRLAYYRHEHLDLDYVSGAFLLLRREAVARTGGFDEQFFMYAEEADLCLRIRRAGYRIAYTPAAEVVHLGGGSAKNAHARNVQRVVSRLRYLKKHRPVLYYQIFRLLSLAATGWTYWRGKMDRPTFKRFCKAHQHLTYSA